MLFQILQFPRLIHFSLKNDITDFFSHKDIFMLFQTIQENGYTQDRTLHYPKTYPDNSKNMSIEATVVTAFFDLGTFRKGPPGQYFTRDVYYNWAKIFRYLANPLVVYTDSEDFKKHIIFVRNESLKFTKIFVIERSSSWAFKNMPRIEKIFNSKDYPKHYPNTVVPAYACAQHAKFDVVERAATRNVFNTKYYMWLDIGYFRNRQTQKLFYLAKPKGFVHSKIAMNLIKFRLSLTKHPEEIMKKNLVLVGGGLVFGEREYMIKFAAQFRRAVQHFLSKGLTNTDQQVIYAMFSKLGRESVKPEVELQVYSSSHESDWFYLGNSMIEEIMNTTVKEIYTLN